MPRLTPILFSTDTSYRVVWWRNAISKSRHARGTQGSSRNTAPSTVNPKIDSRPARYIQPAELVYMSSHPAPRAAERSRHPHTPHRVHLVPLRGSPSASVVDWIEER